MDTEAPVCRTLVNRGHLKLGENLVGKTVTFPAGTTLISVTGPTPGQRRYGEQDLQLTIEHEDIEPTPEGSELPALNPELQSARDGSVIVTAWIKPQVSL